MLPRAMRTETTAAWPSPGTSIATQKPNSTICSTRRIFEFFRRMAERNKARLMSSHCIETVLILPQRKPYAFAAQDARLQPHLSGFVVRPQQQHIPAAVQAERRRFLLNFHAFAIHPDIELFLRLMVELHILFLR